MTAGKLLDAKRQVAALELVAQAGVERCKLPWGLTALWSCLHRSYIVNVVRLWSSLITGVGSVKSVLVEGSVLVTVLGIIVASREGILIRKLNAKEDLRIPCPGCTSGPTPYTFYPLYSRSPLFSRMPS